MDLEIINYDVEGAAYRDGVVVDGAYLLAIVRRRAVVQDGKVTMPAGEPMPLRIDLSKLDASARGKLFDTFGTLEATVKSCCESHYAALSADPATTQQDLDTKLAAAERAERRRKDAEDALAKLDAALAAHQKAAASPREERRG